MKHNVLKHLLVAALLVCTVPATSFAQADKAKDKAKAKKQQIVITRSGDETGKTVIEIDGDKVKINGKDAADLKDVNVHINNLKGSGVWGNNNFDFDLAFDHPTIFSTDSNRAMLGVVTDGDDKGAEIRSVSKASAAEKAGLKKGDIITKIDNRKIETTDDVTDAIRAHKPGDKVSITYLRDDKEQKVTAELGRWKGVDIAAIAAPRVLTDQMVRGNISREFQRAMPGIQGFYPGSGRLGMSVQDTDDGKGVKVLDVDDDGNAAKAGIEEDDIITQVDDKPVNSADEVAKLVREKREQPFVKMQVIRDGKTQTISVRMKQPKKVDL